MVYKFKKPWDDGTGAIKMTQMEFMEKLAALVPRPKVHLTRYHGCLAPHYKFRKQIIPQKKPTPEVSVIATDAEPPENPKRMSWARLLKRVFGIDITLCPKCSGKIKIIAAVEDPTVIRKILTHLELPTTAPRLAPACGPPESAQRALFT